MEVSIVIKGVVVKVKSEYSIILSEGQFYRIKNKESMPAHTA